MLIWKETEQLKQILIDMIHKETFIVVSQSGVIYDDVKNIGELTGIHFEDILKKFIGSEDISGSDPIIYQIQHFVSSMEDILDRWKLELEQREFLIVDSLYEARKAWSTLKDSSKLDKLRIEMITEHLINHEMAIYYDKYLKGYITNISLSDLPF